MSKKNNKKDYLHKEHPKTCAENDFWGQVCRTVKGVPVSQEHIDMIVRTIKNGMNFSAGDILLDIGCGNGALSQYFFDECAKFNGVDFSEYLIMIAKNNFETPPTHIFTKIDAVEYIESEPNPDMFTKALCYGVFSYFSQDQAEKVLSGIIKFFTNINLFFIGNLPDKDRAHLFFPTENDYNDDLLNDRESPIGIWRSRDEFSDLARKTGWNVEFSLMPDNFYSAHYRYDAILKRNI